MTNKFQKKGNSINRVVMLKFLRGELNVASASRSKYARGYQDGIQSVIDYIEGRLPKFL